MDRYKQLYKESIPYTSSQILNEKNRAIQNANRVQKRNDLYMTGRQILMNTDDNTAQLDTESNKENQVINDVKKLNRREMYLSRFHDWKTKKHESKNTVQSNKTAPFIPAGTGVTYSKNVFSFGAQHNVKKTKTFCAPQGLKIPVALTKEREQPKPNSRKSIYTVKEILKKEDSVTYSAAKQRSPMLKKTKRTTKQIVAGPPSDTLVKVVNIKKVPPSTETKMKPVKQISQKPNNNLALQKTNDHRNKTEQMATKKKFIPSGDRNRNLSKVHLDSHNANVMKNKLVPPIEKGVKTNSVIKPITSLDKNKLKPVNGRSVPQMSKGTKQKTAMKGKDVVNKNPAKERVSPIVSKAQQAAVPRVMQKVNKGPLKSNGAVGKIKHSATFNRQTDFTMSKKRNAGMAIPKKPNTESIGKLRENSEFERNGHSDPSSLKTPPKVEEEEAPLLYLSPFVSVSRGKVNRRAEEIKRDSVYRPSIESIPNRMEDAVIAQPKSIEVEKPCTPPHVSRALEAVKYFRKQLGDEIKRLHALCDEWETYKTKHGEQLEEMNGADMINVTIGQTKLLTSKKFMQFKSLIDRCESDALGISAPWDGTEDTRPITPIDLEGFWSMVWLQVENVEKRFENLERWKGNNWQDPDEVKPQIKKNLSKVKKSKPKPKMNNVKPSSALREMLKGMYKQMRAQPKVPEVASPPKSPKKDTPERKRSSAGRLSLVLRESNSFAMAPILVSIPTPERASRRCSLASQTRDSPRFEDCKRRTRNSMHREMLKKKLSNEQNHQGIKDSSRSPMKKNSALAFTPRSVLKTPGTAKSTRKSVIFNRELSVRKFQLDDYQNYDDEMQTGLKGTPEKSSEEDRMYCLRNRKVKLRPSTEFYIP